MIRKWDIKNEQAKKRCLEEIISRMSEEDDVEIGVITAQEIVDIVAQYVGPTAYNMALEDSHQLIQSKMGDLEVDLDVMKAAV